MGERKRKRKGRGKGGGGGGGEKGRRGRRGGGGGGGGGIEKESYKYDGVSQHENNTTLLIECKKTLWVRHTDPASVWFGKCLASPDPAN